MSITREAIIERRQQLLRWSAVFAGAAVSVGLWLLLQTLGAGIGLSTVDPNEPGSLRSAGIGTGIWTAFAPLIALFFGGFVAGRVCGTFSRRTGAMHGLVLWSIATVIGFATIIALATGFARGAVIVNREAVATSGEAIGVTPGGTQFDFYRPRNDYNSRQAADAIGNAMLYAGLAMGLGLLAAVGGAAAGTRKPVRIKREVAVVVPDPDPTTVTTVAVEPPPPAPPPVDRFGRPL
jgi:MFS family permease